MSSNLLTLCAANFKATTQWKEDVLRAYLRGDALRRTSEADQDQRGGPGPARRTRTSEADQDQRGGPGPARRHFEDEEDQRGGQGRTRCTSESDVEGRARRRRRTSESGEEDQRVGQGRTRCTSESDVEGRARRRRRTSEATEEDQRGVYQEERERASQNTTVRSVFEEHRYFEQEGKQRDQIQTTTVAAAATRADYHRGDEQAILSSISNEL
ncbi:uncharacterized protein LOC142659217 isoform X2 [Rhinoderma darwinii]|uniref:uncharacterized protein LOC142659217 isoform X2 n=1 Tax=Rhinoderma darwinii TaxID=43563 RepID=UPI003F666164